MVSDISTTKNKVFPILVTIYYSNVTGISITTASSGILYHRLRILAMYEANTTKISIKCIEMLWKYVTGMVYNYILLITLLNDGLLAKLQARNPEVADFAVFCLMFRYYP